MTPQEISNLVQSLNSPYVLVFAIPLVLGMLLKKTPKIPDWCIPWILCTAGAIVGAFYIGGKLGGGIGFVVGIASVGGHQLWKQSKERDGGNYDDKPNRSSGVKAPCIAWALLPVALLSSSCAQYSKFQALPTDQRIDFLKVEAANFLKDPANREATKKVLVFAGRKALVAATSHDERKAIANQMFASASAFRSLTTGQPITMDLLKGTLRAFAPNLKIPSWLDYIDQVGILWVPIYKNLDLSGDPQLVIDYLNLLAEAAEEVGAMYKEDA